MSQLCRWSTTCNDTGKTKPRRSNSGGSVCNRIEKASADNRLKAQWAPKLWYRVRETIAERVQAVNEALGEPALTCDAARPDWVIIRVNQVFTNVAAAYDAGTGRVTLNLEDHSETYELEVSKGEVRYKEIGSFTPDQVARMLVDKAASLVL